MEVFLYCWVCCGKLKFIGNVFKCNLVLYVGVCEGGKGICILMIFLIKFGIILSVNYIYFFINKLLVLDKS